MYRGGWRAGGHCAKVARSHVYIIVVHWPRDGFDGHLLGGHHLRAESRQLGLARLSGTGPVGVWTSALGLRREDARRTLPQGRGGPPLY